LLLAAAHRRTAPGYAPLLRARVSAACASTAPPLRRAEAFSCVRSIRQMRKTQATCLAPPAISTAAEQFVAADALAPAACGRQPVEYAHTLGYECTLLGRKFPAETGPAVAALYADCASQLRISDAECAAEALRASRLF